MTNKYPIGIFLTNLQNELSLTKSGFLKSLGFKNISKAIRKLDELMLNGHGDFSFVKIIKLQIHDVFNEQ